MVIWNRNLLGSHRLTQPRCVVAIVSFLPADCSWQPVEDAQCSCQSLVEAEDKLLFGFSRSAVLNYTVSLKRHIGHVLAAEPELQAHVIKDMAAAGGDSVSTTKSLLCLLMVTWQIGQSLSGCEVANVAI